MGRYVDADALMVELEREVDLADDWKTAHEIANVVKYFPSADVRENARGHWIFHGTAWGDEYRECSNCKCYFKADMPRNSFCPNCGADMRKPE